MPPTIRPIALRADVTERMAEVVVDEIPIAVQ